METLICEDVYLCSLLLHCACVRESSSMCDNYSCTTIPQTPFSLSQTTVTLNLDLCIKCTQVKAQLHLSCSLSLCSGASIKSTMLAYHSGVRRAPLSVCALSLSFSLYLCLPWPRISSFFTTSSYDPLFRHQLASLSILLPFFSLYQLKRKYNFLLCTQYSTAAACVNWTAHHFVIPLTQNESNDHVFQNSWMHESSRSNSSNCLFFF